MIVNAVIAALKRVGYSRVVQMPETAQGHMILFQQMP